MPVVRVWRTCCIFSVEIFFTKMVRRLEQGDTSNNLLIILILYRVKQRQGRR